MQEELKVQNDDHLRVAGSHMMYLGWFESTMRDLLALAESSPDLRELYNETYYREGVALYPKEISAARLRFGEMSLGDLTHRCFETFSDYPCWQDDTIRGTIDHLSLLRNAFAHAHVQPHRPFLLYTPASRALPNVKRSMRCWKCSKALGVCECNPAFREDPPTLVINAADERFIDALNGDLERMDLQCFLPTASQLGVIYQGMAWWRSYGFLVGRVLRDRQGRLVIDYQRLTPNPPKR